MGNDLTREEKTIVSTWQLLLRRTGIKTTDFALRSMLLWAKDRGFPADTSIALSVSAWQSMGSKLWDAVSRGGKKAQGLATTWQLLCKTLKNWKEEQDERGKELAESECPGEEVGADSQDASQLQVETNCTEPLTPAKKYLSPKDYVKPSYPHPNDFEQWKQPVYLPPADQLAASQLAKMKLTELIPTAPLLPLPPLVTPPFEEPQYDLNSPIPSGSESDNEEGGNTRIGETYKRALGGGFHSGRSYASRKALDFTSLSSYSAASTTGAVLGTS